MGLIKLCRHIALVIRHKNKVLKHCAKCGILWRGIVHDLSKFSPTELFESAKYFNGHRSPIGVCREHTGMSHAWLHHKGRNKHHIEYWLDGDCEVTPLMPYVYAVECVCDKLSATKTYAGRNYSEDLALKHWLKHGNKVDGNPKTMLFIETVFRDLAEHGERYILNKKYMRATYDRICLGVGEGET